MGQKWGELKVKSAKKKKRGGCNLQFQRGNGQKSGIERTINGFFPPLLFSWRV